MEQVFQIIVRRPSNGRQVALLELAKEMNRAQSDAIVRWAESYCGDDYWLDMKWIPESESMANFFRALAHSGPSPSA